MNVLNNYFGKGVEPHESLHVYGQGSYQVPKNASFDVLVWNINKQTPLKVLASLQTLSKLPDFALYQEACLLDNNLEPFSLWDCHGWVMAKNIYVQKKKTFSGVSTGSIFERKGETIWHSQNKEAFVKTPKAAIASLHSIENETTQMLVLNVHLLNFVNQDLFFLELLQMDSQIQNHKGPIVLAGDFNTWSIKRKNLLTNWARQHNLTEVDFKKTNRHRISKTQLSFVFTKHLQTIRASVLDQYRISDHFPLWLELRLL